ncbi:MAG TPA: hypothetical protein VMM55_05070 [Thermohalobaculum sp.]|nr:hypothetical protein [Thermohalobaculum sp.]
MSTGSEGRNRRLDAALARLVAEAAPGPALAARVLADAAMVAAGRRPAPGQGAGTPPRGRLAGLLAGLFARPSFGLAGAAATVAIGVALGYGFHGDEAGSPAAGDLDADVLSVFSPLDRLEHDVIASLDEDLLDPDAPL